MLAASSFDQSNVPPVHLSPDEQRIANAVVAALSPTLTTIRDDISSIKKRFDVLDREMRGVNKIFAANNFIIPDWD